MPDNGVAQPRQQRVREMRGQAGVVVEARDLSVYDTIFGVDPAAAVADGEVA